MNKENTLVAFAGAHKLGYKYCETDVILAASGELVAIHGSANWLQAGFKRDITRGTLQKMSLEQIRYMIRPGSMQVPTLEEVFSAFPKMNFVLDLKTDEAAVPLAELLVRLKLTERVCVTGFSYRRLKVFLEACGQYPVSVGLTLGRGLRFTNINMLMVKSGRLQGIDAVSMHHSLVSAPMVSLIHSKGLKALVWTCNSRLSIKHALRSGADGVMSDRIDLLRDIAA